MDGKLFEWWLERQPQWCHEDGWKGLLIGIKLQNKDSKVAFIQLPFKVESRRSTPQKQRPKIHISDLEKHIKQAIEAGWEPESRGKPFAYEVKASAEND